MIFLNLPCTKNEFLKDGANKTMTCYTFSARKIIPKSKNLKIAMKYMNEIKKMKTFFQGQYFNFGDLIRSEYEIFLNNFWLR